MPKARKTLKIAHSATGFPVGDPRARIREVARPSASLDFPIVAIGASAGGLEALTSLVENLTPDFGMAYLVVEHLDPNHKSMLVELLSRKTTVPIEEARQGTLVAPDRIYVIPPNRNLSLADGRLNLSSRGASPAKHMPIDFLFRSVSRECPGNCIGIVLSGTGSDGSLGVEEIKSADGITLAQDEDSAKHDGMPRSAVATGHIDYVLAPESIALELRRIATHPYTSGKKNRRTKSGIAAPAYFHHPPQPNLS